MAAELSQAIPGPDHPMVDRYLKPSPIWYPWLVKILDFIKGIANGELIVDGAITARTISAGAIEAEAIAADAVTADKIAANAITAESVGTNEIITNSANIKAATVGTLNLAGEAVISPTSYQSSTPVSTTAYTRAQMLSGNNDWTQVATVTVSVPVTSKYIIWWTASQSYRKHIRLFTSTDTITYGVNRYDNPHATRVKVSLNGGTATVIDTFSGLSVSDYVARTNTGTVTVSGSAVTLTVTIEWAGYYDAADEYLSLTDRTLIVWVAKR